MSRVLVTGSSGFIGAHLRDELVANGHEVVGLDLRPPTADDVDTYLADILEPGEFQRVLDKSQPDLVVHLAAKVGRLFGEDDVRATIRDNVEMTATVARACGEAGVRLAYASTSEVYGDRGDTEPVTEDQVYTDAPLTGAYALTKRQGEEHCRMYAPDGLVILRLSMPYGRGLPPGRGRAALPTFIWQAMHREPLTVHRGSERAWCYVQDTVRGIRLALERTVVKYDSAPYRSDANALANLHSEIVGRGDDPSRYEMRAGELKHSYPGGERWWVRASAPLGGTYNVGRDDNPTPMRTIAEWACAITGAPFTLIEEVDPPAHQTVIKRLDTSRLRALGWQPQVELPAGMRAVHDWLIEAGYGPKTLAETLRAA